jgi:hypothetical protein
MSTRGLLSIRYKGLDYVTYNHSDSYPKHLGALIVHFVQHHLQGEEAIHTFGRKTAALEWVKAAADARSSYPQGGDLLAAIAKGEITRLPTGEDLFRTCLDYEYAYILDLDERVLEFWDLSERIETFPLATLHPCAVGVMECERRH